MTKKKKIHRIMEIKAYLAEVVREAWELKVFGIGTRREFKKRHGGDPIDTVAVAETLRKCIDMLELEILTGKKAGRKQEVSAWDVIDHIIETWKDVKIPAPLDRTAKKKTPRKQKRS